MSALPLEDPTRVDAASAGEALVAPARLVVASALAAEREAIRGFQSVPTRLPPIEFALASAVPTPTLVEYIDSWLRDREELRESSLETYRSWIKNHIEPFFAGVTIDQLTDENARAFACRLRGSLAPSTTQNILVFLGAVVDEACVEGFLTRNPIRSIPKRLKGKRQYKPPRVLVRSEIAALLGVIPPDGFERAIFMTLLFAGLRSGEARGLLWAEVDFTAMKIRVRRQANPMGVLGPLKTPMSTRDVNLDPLLARELLAHRERQSTSNLGHLVFPRNDKPMRQQFLWYRVGRAARLGGIAHTTVHNLRHTYGSILIAAGADVTYVQRQMGHASPQVTLRAYAGLWDEQGNIDKVSAFLEERFGCAA